MRSAVAFARHALCSATFSWVNICPLNIDNDTDKFVAMQAFTHTMFDTSIDAAWHALCVKLDAASIAAQADRAHSTSAAAGYLGDVGKAHQDYLSAVYRACWLPNDSNSQVCTSLSFFSILDLLGS
jgi:hypothetical protein